MEILKSPETRKAALKAITGLGKLGGFAVANLFIGKIFREATTEYIAVIYQDYRKLKSMVTN